MSFTASVGCRSPENSPSRRVTFDARMVRQREFEERRRPTGGYGQLRPYQQRGPFRGQFRQPAGARYSIFQSARSDERTTKFHGTLSCAHAVQDRWVGSNNEDFRIHNVHDRDRDAIDVEEHPTSTKYVLTVINSDTSNPYVGKRHVNDGVRLASPPKRRPISAKTCTQSMTNNNNNNINNYIVMKITNIPYSPRSKSPGECDDGDYRYTLSDVA